MAARRFASNMPFISTEFLIDLSKATGLSATTFLFLMFLRLKKILKYSVVPQGDEIIKKSHAAETERRNCV